MTENKKNFLIELEQISRKYGLYVDGCGCCGSPSLEPLEGALGTSPEAGYAYVSQVQWVSPAYL